MTSIIARVPGDGDKEVRVGTFTYTPYAPRRQVAPKTEVRVEIYDPHHVDFDGYGNALNPGMGLEVYLTHDRARELHAALGSLIEGLYNHKEDA